MNRRALTIAVSLALCAPLLAEPPKALRPPGPIRVLVVDGGYFESRRSNPELLADEKKAAEVFDRTRGADNRKVIAGHAMHGSTVVSELSHGLSSRDVLMVTVDESYPYRDNLAPLVDAMEAPKKATHFSSVDTRKEVDAILDSSFERMEKVLAIFTKNFGPPPDLVNYSWSNGLYGNTPELREYSRKQYSARYRKLFRRYPQTLFFLAAGNAAKESRKTTERYGWSDLNVPNAIVVGSLNPETGERSEFSNYGKDVSIYVSGENTRVRTWRMFRGRPLKRVSEFLKKPIEVEGTSFAAPRAANLTLLKLLELRKTNPKATLEDAYQALLLESLGPGLHSVHALNRDMPIRTSCE